mgnify:CR=1 FL=1
MLHVIESLKPVREVHVRIVGSPTCTRLHRQGTRLTFF